MKSMKVLSLGIIVITIGIIVAAVVIADDSDSKLINTSNTDNLVPGPDTPIVWDPIDQKYTLMTGPVPEGSVEVYSGSYVYSQPDNADEYFSK